MKVSVQRACHSCSLEQLCYLWADEKDCKHLAAKLQENQQLSTHPIVLSCKTADSAAITQAKKNAVGHPFFFFALSKKENSLCENDY